MSTCARTPGVLEPRPDRKALRVGGILDCFPLGVEADAGRPDLWSFTTSSGKDCQLFPPLGTDEQTTDGSSLSDYEASAGNGSGDVVWTADHTAGARVQGPLTGLVNHRASQERLEAELARARRENSRSRS